KYDRRHAWGIRYLEKLTPQQTTGTQMKNGKLNGKVAGLTGACKGIAAAIAKEFADEGARVVINYASAKEDAERSVDEITKRGRRHHQNAGQRTRSAQNPRQRHQSGHGRNGGSARSRFRPRRSSQKH